MKETTEGNVSKSWRGTRWRRQVPKSDKKGLQRLAKSRSNSPRRSGKKTVESNISLGVETKKQRDVKYETRGGALTGGWAAARLNTTYLKGEM